MAVGLLIFGIILAIVGYVLERKTTGVLSTLGTIFLWIGVLVAIVALIIILLGIAGISLAFLPILA